MKRVLLALVLALSVASSADSDLALPDLELRPVAPLDAGVSCVMRTA